MLVHILLKIRKVIVRNFMPIIFKLLPIKNIYLFSSYYGQYNDSPRNISEILHRKDQNAKIYWIVDPNKNHNSIPDYVNKIKINTIKSAYYLYTAKILIDNCQKQLVFKLRKKQIYLQTWHGTPLKRIEFDAQDSLSKRYLHYSEVDNNSISYLMLSNGYSETIYRSAFHASNAVMLESGTPRNDILLNNNRPESAILKKKLNIKTDTYIILYAPTFRNNLASNGIMQLKKLNPKKLIAGLQKQLGRKCILLTRFHPNVQELIDKNQVDHLFGNNIIDVTGILDMQSILNITDFLITDYSSSFFDFAITNRPIGLFTYDYSNYIKERGTYTNPEELPLFNFTEINQLIEFIKIHGVDALREKTKQMNQRINNFEDGGATLRAVQLLFEEMGRNHYG